ncbi:B3 domain-containing transcription factor FUS3-like [Rhododendron vialii]|uniref:B3 domain-containing transcription factor FUS3-like n=1 Tax=Rhododendron vialii TaxID=182163 RepID=UPI00265E3D85|nr:B3 domain-containing transcription factor FUS3-like [Rhododendron vialii]
MFVLEKTGDFVRAHGLQSGDFMMVYKDGQSERFGIRARKASSQVTGPQHELNRSKNYYADLTAMNGTCFPPENILYNFPMNFTAEVVPDVSNVEQSLSYGSINTFSLGNFW